jgi:glycosyltransferase involved in cell wall biosynthesis
MVAARLPSLVDPHIQLIHEAMPRTIYEQILVDSDIVLLPYQRSVYWARTSYPFAEAMAAAKPVIVTSNTWMSDQVMRYGSGLVIEATPRAVLGGIENMVRSYDHYAERARSASARWRENNNAESLARALVGALPDAPSEHEAATRR